MRRFLPTFILLLVLLLIGGLAVTNAFGNPATTHGPYIPTFSSDPTNGPLEGWIFFIALGAIVTGTIGTGAIIAIAIYRFTVVMASNPPKAAVADARSAGAPKSNTGDHGLGIPLSNPRSVAIFWIVVVLVVVGFQALRYTSQPISVAPFGYIPSIADFGNIVLFRLPGTHIEGIPAFIAGPGDEVKAIHLLIATLGLAVVGVAVVGFGLARGFAQLDTTVRNANKFKPTLPDKLIPQVEQRIADLRAPRPKRLPGNPIDGYLIAVNVGLFVVIAGIIAFYVVPSFSGVAAVDNALEATRIAAIAPPTATAQPGGPSPADIEQAEFDKLPAGDATAGQTVFQGAGGCSACHSLVEGQVLVGPSQHGISERAPVRKANEGYSAQAYLYESITNPNAYVVEGFQPNIMPQTFKQTLQPQQIADVIAFLLTQ